MHGSICPLPLVGKYEIISNGVVKRKYKKTYPTGKYIRWKRKKKKKKESLKVSVPKKIFISTMCSFMIVLAYFQSPLKFIPTEFTIYSCLQCQLFLLPHCLWSFHPVAYRNQQYEARNKDKQIKQNKTWSYFPPPSPPFQLFTFPLNLNSHLPRCNFSPFASLTNYTSFLCLYSLPLHASMRSVQVYTYIYKKTNKLKNTLILERLRRKTTKHTYTHPTPSPLPQERTSEYPILT